MAKFYGKVGYGIPTESAPGVFVDVITEKSYYGEILRNTRRQDVSETINPKISVSNSISIVCDAFAEGNFMAIRYVEWAGTRWTVTTVDVHRPRLVLGLGEVYNGPTA